MALVNFFWTSILFPKQQLLYYFHCDLKQNSRKTKERPGGHWQTLASLCFLLAIFDRLQPFSFVVNHFSVISDASAVIICTAFSRHDLSTAVDDSRRILLEPTLFAPVTYMHITMQLHVGACWKDSTFPNYDFRKEQCTFYPIKVSPFAGKKFVRNTKISYPYKLGQTPLDQQNISKVKHNFQAF